MTMVQPAMRAAPALRAIRKKGKFQGRIPATTPKKIDLWDEFTPNLYQIGVSAGYEYYETTFGMRELAREGEQLLINRRPLYLRGVVERHQFSEGYPPTDEHPWQTIFQRYKDCGP